MHWFHQQFEAGVPLQASFCVSCGVLLYRSVIDIIILLFLRVLKWKNSENFENSDSLTA